MKNIFLFLFVCISQSYILAQSSSCNNATAFCTNSGANFPASTGNNSPNGPNYGCLFTQPNPAFFFLQIDNPGNITLSLFSTPANDIDFICWGPFSDPTTMCNQLTAANTEDCSYSASSIETCQINGATAGDYYVLLITNYSNSSCNINFSQTAGNGTTDCCIAGDAGIDNSIDICLDDGAFIMENQLNGTPDNGGIWYNNSWTATTSNNFNPGNWIDGTYAYIVQGTPVQGTGALCPNDTSYLTVNINPSPIITFPTLADICSDNTPFNLNGASPVGGIYSGSGVNNNTFTASNNNVGNNTITYSYTDQNGCVSSNNQNIIVNPSPSATALTTDVSCNGFSDGTAILAILGGTPNYSINWGGYNPTNLSAGSYIYTITDINNCIYSDSVTISEPNPFSIIINKSDISCNGQNDGQISILNQSNLTTYLWSNSATTSNINNLSNGTYSVNVTNNSGCTLTEYITINEPLPITSSLLQNNVSCHGINDGSISLNINGGSPNYTINLPPYNQTLSTGINTFTTSASLSPGVYIYDITDSNGCLFNSSFTISEPDPIYVTETVTNISCNGLSDGTTILSIIGGTPPYFENWGGLNPISLGSGIANYQVTDNNGCIYSDSVSIAEPSALSIIYTQTNVSSCSLSDGSISCTIIGGTAPYSYLWNNGSTNKDLNSLSSGTYSLTVSDDNGCTTLLNATITDPSSPNLSFTKTDVNCNGGNNGSIDLSISGGSSPYNYIWSNGEITEDINGLSAGQYSVQVIDNNTCIENITIIIDEPQSPNILTTQINVDCNGNSTGSINLSINGNAFPYSVLWNSGQITQNINNLSAGNYSYTITDNDNCTYSNMINIIQPNILQINPNVVDVRCKNENNGSITLNTSGGTMPYQEDFGLANPTALSAGIYPITITDSNGCIYLDIIVINEPDSLTVNATYTDASCSGYYDGTASLSINGGTPTYNTNWGQSNPNGLNAGLHSYIVSDVNNCITQGTLTISEPQAIQIIVDTFNVSCFGLSDGSASLTISAGAGPPYTQNWGGLNPNGLAADSHLVYVSDINNCTAQAIVIISEPTIIQSNPILNHVSCFGGNDGDASLQISGGTAPYIQNWNGNNISSLSAGTYFYSITDNNNCIKNDLITIIEPDSLKVIATINNANCFNSNDGNIILTITGGTQPYIEDFFGDNPYSLEAGNYNFSVIDINGCRFDSNAIVSQANQVNLNYSAESPICKNDSTLITININNPLSNQYTIIIEDSIQKSFLIDSLGKLVPEGVKLKLSPKFNTNLILLSITDDNGCKSSVNDTAEVIINQLPIIDLNISDLCEGTASFLLDIATPEGGNYYVNGEYTDFIDMEKLDKGSHNILYQFTDKYTSCSAYISKDIQINPAPKANFTFSPQPANIDEPDILFISNNSDAEHSIWDLGDETIKYDETRFWHTYSDTGKYEITYIVDNQFNCTDTLIASLIINPVYQIYIPSSFTPNNDGDNDIFKPYVNGSIKYTVTILNRWGGIIFQKENEGWDGTIEGKEVKEDVYVYTIIVYDFKNKPFSYSGIISLIK